MDPHESLPARLRGEAGTVGTSRVLTNAARTPDAVLMPHWIQTRREAASREQVMMIGDGTSVTSSRHPSVQGGGPVGLGKGFFIHSVLARDAQTEEVLGCASHHSVVRPSAPERETKGQRTRRPRESQVWEQSVRALGPVPEGS